MTIFAGAFAFDNGASLNGENTACWEKFFGSLGPHEGARLERIARPQLTIWKWDSGAHGEPAWQVDADGSFAALCGDPLLADAGRRLHRSEQLTRLRSSTQGLDGQRLSQTRGVFSALAFNCATSTLCLATDMVGIRPVFHSTHEGVFYFASALHLLERLPQLARSVDQQGLAEHLTLGFCFADRTPYAEIRQQPEATLLHISGQGCVQQHYFDWSLVGLSGIAEHAAGPALYETFHDAVGLRLDGAETAHAFLSGGMDSRSIVATLAAHGCRIEAMNFSLEGTQDKAFATDYAETLKGQCRLTQHTTHNFPNFSMLARAALTERSGMEAGDALPVPVRQVWSGDGGSVCLGYVYLDDAIMQAAQDEQWPKAAGLLMRKNKLQVPSGLLSQPLRERMDEALLQGVLSEMQHYDNGDSGRRLYFFLLFNDQRRHLFKHFETIHEHTLELVLPFFDTKLLTTVVGTPAKWGIGHRLYGKFFAQLPPATRSVPWQTYPGHEPCPVPAPQNYRYQWDRASRQSSAQSFGARKAAAGSMLRLLGRPELAALVSKVHVTSAAALHLTGLRDYDYLVSAAQKLAALRINPR